MLNTEDRLIEFSGIPVEKDFAWIEMDGRPFRVRNFKFGDKAKKTLVFIGGYSFSVLRYVSIFRALSERYRVVAIEHGSYGMNTKLIECSGYASHEAAEDWIIDFLLKVFNKLDLPEKFYLLGLCYGGVLAPLYASVQPHRVESLFCCHPAGF